MIRNFLISTLLLLASSSAFAKPGTGNETFGLGLGAGTIANGLSGKYFVNEQHAIQANLGLFGGGGAADRFTHYNGFGLSADYLVELGTIVQAADVMELAWNVGVGAGLGLNSKTFAFAGALVLGLEFNFLPVPIDVVIEYRPGLLIVPSVNFEPVDFTGHIRYYF